MAITELMIDPHGDELYLDDAGKPCLRMIEALGRIENNQRIGGAGVYIEKFVEGEWRHLEGPFFGSLTGWPQRALDALERHRRAALAEKLS